MRSIHSIASIIALLAAVDVESFSSSSSSRASKCRASMQILERQQEQMQRDARARRTARRRTGGGFAPQTGLASMVSDEEAEMLLADFYDEEGEGLAQQEKEQQKQPIRRFKRPKKVPLIAVVGRPNVGKSALVNRLAGTQSGGAIVADEEGITRDRTYRNAEFLGEAFQLVDTGGLVFDDTDAIFAREIREQAMIAIEESSGVILVVDGQVGPTAMDEQLARFLRKEVTNKMPVLLAVNKCESDKNGAYLASQFWNLGLGEPHAVSALHGVGTADLLEDMFEGIVEKGSAIKGFGTKVKELEAAQQALVALDKGEALEGEDETDVFLRQYGVGRDSEEVIRRYEEAMSAFDDVPTMVRTKWRWANRDGCSSA